MGDRDPHDSTLRTDSQALRTRSPTERGIMWLAPRQWFFPFRANKMLLGRGEDAACVLAGAEVSRYHAEIADEGALTVLRDLGSTNGTHLGGRRIEREFLRKQDVVRLGEWVGVVCSVPRGSIADIEEVSGIYAGHTLRAVLSSAEQIAPSDLPVILRGESGTGKERVARFIHEKSGRRGAFVAVNCAALPESLAEAELFGHSRGAYTGADRARAGYLREAHEGTLLLDEISDLPLAIQAKLLRVLEESVVTPLGESRPVRVQLRVIAAGQKSLAELVRAGKFRGDLYARLNGMEFVLPPLRQRREEIPYIFGAVLRENASGYAPLLQPKLVERLCVYDWPYNVRELVQVTRRIAALYAGVPALREESLPPELLPPPDSRLPGKASERRAPRGASPLPGQVLAPDRATPPPRALSPVPGSNGSQPANLGELSEAYRAQEIEAIRRVLQGNGGNVADTARVLGISRQRLYRLVGHTPELDISEFRKR